MLLRFFNCIFCLYIALIMVFRGPRLLSEADKDPFRGTQKNGVGYFGALRSPTNSEPESQIFTNNIPFH